MVEHTRSLGFRVAFALGLGTMIAAGIFSLSGTAVAAIGSSAVVAFVIAAIIASITAASYSEFASIYSENGGGYLFSSRTFEDRDFLVYVVGASLFMGYTGTTAFYLATMDEWFVEFVIPQGWPVPHGAVAVLTAVVLGALNAKGTEESGTFQVFVTGAKVAILLAFIGGAFAYKPPAETVSTFTSSFSTDAAGIVTIAALAFITFFGFSAIAASAGEIIKPRKTVPRAIAASIVTVTVLYIFVIVAMVNSPIPAEVIAQEGETAMGRVAEAFLGSIGMNLIVAGAIFSMVSASNASILAATGIGALMGRQGQAPRRFSRIHPDYGTPFWSVTTGTATIVALIVLFIGVFPAEDGLLGLDLGLTALTGFATLNLLAPLSLVNGALIYSRRRYPELERPVRVPLVPLVPILGIIANLGLITNLPVDGAVAGVLVVAGLAVAYLVWGGAPDVEELFERVVEPSGTSRSTATGVEAGGEAADDRYRILVPIARPHRAPHHVRLAATVGALRDGEPFIQVVNVTNIPDQTPNEMVVDLAERRADRLRGELDGVDVDAEVTVEGHICRDVAFDIVQTARDDGADLIVMGYAEEHPDIAETVQYDAPCDVLYSNGIAEAESFETVNVGAGGGPHHRALLSLVNAFGRSGADVHVINVSPTADTGGTAEDVHDTLDDLPDTDTIQVHSVQAASVAEGLVDTAAETGGVLVIGATRTRRLKKWVFGSTPDRVINLADAAGVPVIVYANVSGIHGQVEDYLFPVYRYVKRLRSDRRPIARGETREQ